jgi:hypothetical protein
MRGLSATLKTARAKPPNHSSRPPPCGSRRWAELAGRSVALSGDIPVLFDGPLAPHHKLIGRWAATREKTASGYTRPQARRHIERVFNAAVFEILNPVELADLRITILHGEETLPPAIAIVCDDLGQLDLGWIETSDAPIPWRAAAYAVLEQTLGCILPISSYQDLFDEISLYYWEGETDDEAARRSLVDYHGADVADLDELTLPSEMNARRPEWMIGANADLPDTLPTGLRETLSKVRETHNAFRSLPSERNAWHFSTDIIRDYVPDYEECSAFPPLTLVPFEHFARELDDVARHGMEYGFMDIAGLCPLSDASWIDDWFASLQLGAQFLLAAQTLIQFDPTSM